MKKTKVCRSCKRFTTDNTCPSCKSSNMSASWKGVVVVLDTEGDIAKALNITEPGKYALYVG